MALLTTISGIRGTIGGPAGQGLTPIDIVKFSSAFYAVLSAKSDKKRLKLIIGRDGRISGPIVHRLVTGSLMSMGAEIIDLGLSTTPTVEMAVTFHKADGGIIITASHNPKEWNALKLLNAQGEFISGELGEELLKLADSGTIDFAGIDDLGSISEDHEALRRHIDAICQYPLVNLEAIKEASFKIGFDAINSSGGFAVPQLLEALGVKIIQGINTEAHGNFSHNPEPLPHHLTELAALVKNENLDLGIAVDPDVDRLAFMCEDGSFFGEEYTLVAVADYVLSKRTGNTVSNLSSTRALRDVTISHGGTYTASAVGEVNVVNEMKAVNAVIGGEGNGGIIVPDLHYGRDALIGIALFLSLLAERKQSASALRSGYPNYEMAKEKISLSDPGMVSSVLEAMKTAFAGAEINTVDGVKVDLPEGWVHLRPSNTEPIIRVYSESNSSEAAALLAKRAIEIASNVLKNAGK